MVNFKFSTLSVLLILSSLLPVATHAQSKPNKIDQQPHYCGTKLTQNLISDKTFGPACQRHDECLQNSTDRGFCRRAFKNDMKDICNSLPEGKETKLRFWTSGERKSFCFKKASIYAGAVGIYDLFKED
jgi:hypothetical protein